MKWMLSMSVFIQLRRLRIDDAKAVWKLTILTGAFMFCFTLILFLQCNRARSYLGKHGVLLVTQWSGMASSLWRHSGLAFYARRQTFHPCVLKSSLMQSESKEKLAVLAWAGKCVWLLDQLSLMSVTRCEIFSIFKYLGAVCFFFRSRSHLFYG